jgi:Carboxypeptidase regulatory-like domain/TonB dependent receptor-like, beta-barrel
MFLKSRSVFSALLVASSLVLLQPNKMQAQQTLGGITGQVVDPAGSAVPSAQVKATSDDTKLERTTTSNAQGIYTLNDLPIGKYTVTVMATGFSTEKIPSILVQADRTVSLQAQLKVGAIADSVEVDINPLLNAVDTTNGYVLDRAQIEAIPLPTGSFTGVAILTPGVNAELPGGTGVNSGLGNAPIWANGERDTSNSFLLNGVDGSNLFNGKSTSQVASSRIGPSTGVGNTGGGGVIQSSASVYLSIGNALPSPAPETIQEVRVNASMYDAQQGATSGAHIDLSTTSGTNAYHGSLYLHRATNWLNAAPFFFNQDGAVPASDKVPQLHRYVLGGVVGGPIIKDKLFGFLAYQHLHVSDAEIGDSFLDVPVGLTDDRSPQALSAITNASFGDGTVAGAIDPVALALFNSPSLKGEPGKWLIPNAIPGRQLMPGQTFNAFVPGTATFIGDQAVANLDYNATSKDTLALKYYYQHDPTAAPYAYSNVPGFTQKLDAGSQVFSINNTYLIGSSLSTQETLGFLREKLYNTNDQAFGPTNIPGGSYPSASIDTFGSNYFPGLSVIHVLGDSKVPGISDTLNIGPGAGGQGSLTGVFQNRLQPSGNAIWVKGKHSIGFGGSYSFTQLNIRDRRPGTGTVASNDMGQFLNGLVTPNDSYNVTTFLQGNANRYYRANQLGLFLQDKFQIKPNLTITAGLRYDWDAGMTEKNGNIFNFDPSQYSYINPTGPLPAGEAPGSLGPTQSGFIIAGNNKNGTAGVSSTTLTGRQWGLAPRLGAAWQPGMFHNKVVVRSGMGLYYDRGELFSYFSPGYAIGLVTGGPFGVVQQVPFVTAQSCPTASYQYGYIPTCAGGTAGSLEFPYTNIQNAPPTNPNASDFAAYLPNAAAITNGAQPVSLGVYDRKNKLPYSINYTLDIQWQPRNDLAFDFGYVGNLGRHQVIPVPFNQPNIASPTSAVHSQNYSYGYTPTNPDGSFITLGDGSTALLNFEGGNIDLRVPYIGYAAESISYKAAGDAAYNALQVHVDKRMGHGFQLGASYTYSHALDEQSAMGLFYNGNNPVNLRDGYASSDFDRTNVFNFSYVYKAPDFFGKSTLAGKFTDGWSLVGLTVLQSGQPFSVVDFSGAVGSLYYSVYDGVTNPIVPLNYSACSPKKAQTGHSGAFGVNYLPALNPQCFTVPLVTPGSPLAAAVPDGDTVESSFTTGQRNIFRQQSQKRADISLVKMTNLTERVNLKYTFDVYNLTNTTSFDIPGNEVFQNQNFNQFPAAGQTALATGCDSSGNQTNESFYNCPAGLGYVTHTIGAPRQIQMSLQLTF